VLLRLRIKKMASSRRQVFYSFHFDNDVMRTQLVRNMGIVEGDQPASANEWEQLKKKDGGQKQWIDDNMRSRSCVIVLVGEKTHERPWVRYEIKKAFQEKKGCSASMSIISKTQRMAHVAREQIHLISLH
jgi:hypothetical protein